LSQWAYTLRNHEDAKVFKSIIHSYTFTKPHGEIPPKSQNVPTLKDEYEKELCINITFTFIHLFSRGLYPKQLTN